MSSFVRALFRGRAVQYAVLALAALALLVMVGVFVVNPGSATPEPVSFEETTDIGLTAEQRTIRDNDSIQMPRVQVFYSQYQYVVGYHGVKQALAQFRQPNHQRQFGYPTVVYVSGYDGTGVEVTGSGQLSLSGTPDWVDATEAHFVVGSEAQSAVGSAVVPFAQAEQARAFTAAYGGTVYDWSDVQSLSFDISDGFSIRSDISTRQAQGDQRIEAVTAYSDRPVETVVGEDTTTVQAAIDRAPPNTTVLVPAGTYEETVEVHKPLTLRGQNATLLGDGNGTVVSVKSDAVEVTGFDIAGVGDTLHGESLDSGGDEWDSRIQSGYGTGDAGIAINGSANVSVRNVGIETPANGILLRSSPGGAIRNVTVNGTERWGKGFMGVMAMHSPVVVQNSTFRGGRDGIYLHRSHGTVIRGNTFRDNRFGVHFMYTADSLVENNVATGQVHAGITIMTSPTRNAIVGNWIRNASTGIIPGGSRSYIADNVIAHNERGITTSASQSVYERNLLFGNTVGIQTGSIRPSNLVFKNDFVANGDHADAGIGPLRVWTYEDTGNYWSGVSESAAALDQSYSPTDALQRTLHRTDGALTLTQSPAVRALTAVSDQSPGLRQGEIVDTAPRAQPLHEDVIAALERGRWPPATRAEGE